MQSETTWCVKQTAQKTHIDRLKVLLHFTVGKKGNIVVAPQKCLGNYTAATTEPFSPKQVEEGCLGNYLVSMKIAVI